MLNLAQVNVIATWNSYVVGETTRYAISPEAAFVAESFSSSPSLLKSSSIVSGQRVVTRVVCLQAYESGFLRQCTERQQAY